MISQPKINATEFFDQAIKIPNHQLVSKVHRNIFFLGDLFVNAPTKERILIAFFFCHRHHVQENWWVTDYSDLTKPIKLAKTQFKELISIDILDGGEFITEGESLKFQYHDVTF